MGPEFLVALTLCFYKGSCKKKKKRKKKRTQLVFIVSFCSSTLVFFHLRFFSELLNPRLTCLCQIMVITSIICLRLLLDMTASKIATVNHLGCRYIPCTLFYSNNLKN